ncbi:MAG: AMP-binding protein [Desulfomonilaceae bacterium]|nr:AMP-binding protein [Desulfomonilaceae bacterium]
MNLSYIIDAAATYFADKPALISGSGAYTYGELRTRINRVASCLLAEGLQRGDMVALHLPNSAEWVVSYYGVIRAGGVVLCLNPAYKRYEIEHLLRDSQPRLLITCEKLADRVPETGALPGLDSVIVFESHPVLSTVLETTDGCDTSPALVHTDADDPCVILYTGGTTGTPKGAMLTHRNILFTAHNVCYHERTRPEDRSLCFMPLNHVFGGNHIMNGIFYGCGTLVLHDGFDLDRILDSLVTDRVTRFYAVPTVFVRLLAQPKLRRHFSTVNYCFSAATSMASEIVRKWLETYGLTIHEAYGMTETSSLVTYNHMYRHKIGSVGTPAGIVEVGITDPDGKPVPTDQTGEIRVRGPNVMKGYLGRPAETSAMVRDGWLHTGDVGRIDRDGYLFIVDRIKDVIITGGYNVFPSEVEEVLYQHPDISECAVVGLEDRDYGEAVTAFVVAKQGRQVAAAELISFCKERLASYKVPKTFKVVADLPKSSTGKILRRKIRDPGEPACG